MALQVLYFFSLGARHCRHLRLMGALGNTRQNDHNEKAVLVKPMPLDEKTLPLRVITHHHF